MTIFHIVPSHLLAQQMMQLAIIEKRGTTFNWSRRWYLDTDGNEHYIQAVYSQESFDRLRGLRADRVLLHKTMTGEWIDPLRSLYIDATINWEGGAP